MKPIVEGFFDKATFTITYVVADPSGSHCAIIDSVLDYDPKSGRTSTGSADKVIEHIRRKELTVDWILETHAHADHLSAAPYLKEVLGGYTGISEGITVVQGIFKDVFHAESDFAANGSQFDQLFCDGETFHIGDMDAHSLHTPGHTPACLTYVIGDTAFVGDTLFMPDYGTARADFPGGDARTLYRSIQRVLALPEDTRLFMCHDYLAPGRKKFAWETTVTDERDNNVHVRDVTTEDEFVALRTERDKTLEMPTLLLPSVQVNMRAGHLPPPEDNGTRYLKIPLNAL
jgi:glyoxylase-like metal-dependent hydrolase (beta-lactamase superfamily II)